MPVAPLAVARVIQPKNRAAMSLNLTVPARIQIVDDPLPNGRQNLLDITVWLAQDELPDVQKQALRVIAIGFLERTLEALREPAAT
jgi:hypothetical protein